MPMNTATIAGLLCLAAVAPAAESEPVSRSVRLEGDFTLTKDVFVQVAGGVSIDATDATFRSEDKTLHIIGGTEQASTTLHSEAFRYDTTIRVKSHKDVKPGQFVRLLNREKFDPSGTKSTIEWNKVVGIVGNRVYLQFPLLVDHATADLDFYSAATGFEWRGGEFIGTSLRLKYLDAPQVSGVQIQGPLRYGIFVLGCIGDTIRNCTVNDPGHGIKLDGIYGTGGQEYGYGIIHTNCANSNVVDCHGYNGWHIFDAADGVRDVTYTNCSASGSLYGFSTHQSCVSASYVNCRSLGKHGHSHRCRYLNIEGGLIQNDSLAGVALMSNQWEARIKGVRFEGRPDGTKSDIMLGSGPSQSHPQRFTIEDCSFTSFKGIGLSTTAPGSTMHFKRNTIRCERESGSISLHSGLLLIDDNTIENLGSNGFVLTGEKTFVRRNHLTGERLDTPQATLIYSQGEGGVFYVEDNTIDVELYRVMRVLREGITIKNWSGNRLLKGTIGGAIQLTGQAKRLVVERANGNLLSHANNKFGVGVEVVNHVD